MGNRKKRAAQHLKLMLCSVIGGEVGLAIVRLILPQPLPLWFHLFSIAGVAALALFAAKRHRVQRYADLIRYRKDLLRNAAEDDSLTAVRKFK